MENTSEKLDETVMKMKKIAIANITTVVPVMNGHPRDQAKVSVHCRWPLIRGTDGHFEMSRDIDNVAVHSRWPLTTGVAQGRYYCTTSVRHAGISEKEQEHRTWLG